MQLCKHEKYRTIDWILEPKYSTDEILIRKADKPAEKGVRPEVEHYIIRFKKCSKYPDWFYMSGEMIRKHREQRNGYATVYVVPMNEAQPFEPLKNCPHEL